MRIAYLGTPAVAVPPLLALLDADFEVCLVVSGEDKRRGRGSKLQPSPVKAAAVERGLLVTDQINEVLDHDVDLGVVVAYGRLIRANLLDQVPMVNLHFSLLPRWRGAAPVERAILAGDSETGVCLMAIDEGLDTGGVYRRITVPIKSEDTLESLRATLVEEGAELLVDGLRDGLGQAVPQTGDVTYASKIQPNELFLDLESPAEELHRVVRLGRAWLGHDGKRLGIWEAEIVRDGETLAVGELSIAKTRVVVGCGHEALLLKVVQPEGKPRMAATAWRNGAQLKSGDRLE